MDLDKQFIKLEYSEYLVYLKPDSGFNWDKKLLVIVKMSNVNFYKIVWDKFNSKNMWSPELKTFEEIEKYYINNLNLYNLCLKL